MRIRRVLWLLLAVVLTFTLISCGDEEKIKTTYDEQGNVSGIYTRMLGSPDCMEYKTYENGVLVGGMLCYYDENGEIDSTEIYEIQEYEKGSVISYYDTDGTLIASSGYRDSYDDKGNLVLSQTYTDGSFEGVSARVAYTYEWISLD